jgi:hypothetical protein
LASGDWEVVESTVALMKGAKFRFSRQNLTISGGGQTVTRNFNVTRHYDNNGQQVFDVSVDNDSLIIMKTKETVPGTESIVMSWGRDGSGSLGLGRRLR